MRINIQPSDQFPNTALTVTPDVGRYALVTFDGDRAGTFSVMAVPDAGWDDAAVKTAILNFFGFTEQTQ